MHPHVSAKQERDDLFALQLAVARKADELARDHKSRTGLKLHRWLLAEAEIPGRAAVGVVPAGPAMPARLVP